jgi:hypothetical protein
LLLAWTTRLEDTGCVVVDGVDAVCEQAATNATTAAKRIEVRNMYLMGKWVNDR